MPTELHGNDGIVRAVRDRDGVAVETVQVELEAVDLGQEAGERDDPCGTLPALVRAPRPSSSPLPARSRRGSTRPRGTRSSSRNASNRGSVEWKVSGSGVGMPPSRYQCHPPGGSASGPCGVTPSSRRSGSSSVEQRVQVVHARAAAVEQDERAFRLLCGGADEPLERLRHGAVVRSERGSGSGVSTCSTRGRRCSNAGGSTSDSPSCSGSSSIEKPGPSVASSNSTPLGSRK